MRFRTTSGKWTIFLISNEITSAKMSDALRRRSSSQLWWKKQVLALSVQAKDENQS